MNMADFKLQLVFRPHTDTAQASRVQITKNWSELCLPKQFVQLGRRRVIGQKSEGTVCFDVFCCPEESAPGCQRETGADRDAPHTKIRESGQCKLMIKSRDEDVDRSRRDSIYDLCYLTGITYGGRVQTIGAGFSVCGESVECGVQRIGIADQPRFATAG